MSILLYLSLISTVLASHDEVIRSHCLTRSLVDEYARVVGDRSSPWKSKDVQEGLFSGRLFDEGVLIVHQNGAILQARTAEFLEKNQKLKKVPRVALVSAHYQVVDPQYLKQLSRLDYSSGGEIPGDLDKLRLDIRGGESLSQGHLPRPFKAKVMHFMGGFCRLCLKQSVNRVLDYGPNITQFIFHSELIYTHRWTFPMIKKLPSIVTLADYKQMLEKGQHFKPRSSDPSVFDIVPGHSNQPLENFFEIVVRHRLAFSDVTYLSRDKDMIHFMVTLADKRQVKFSFTL